MLFLQVSPFFRTKRFMSQWVRRSSSSASVRQPVSLLMKAPLLKKTAAFPPEAVRETYENCGSEPISNAHSPGSRSCQVSWLFLHGYYNVLLCHMYAAMGPNVDTTILIMAGLARRAIQVTLKRIKYQWQQPSFLRHFSLRSWPWSYMTVLLAVALHWEYFILFEINPLGKKLLGDGCLSMIVSVGSVHFVFWVVVNHLSTHFDMSIHKD